MAWEYPAISDFKTRFDRDFNYVDATDPANMDKIRDIDVSRAIASAKIHFNQGLGYGSEAGLTEAFLMLSAFYLVWDIQTSGKGVSSQFNFPVSSQGVDGVSLGYSIPERYTKNAYIANLAQNQYGARFFMMTEPYLHGRVEVAQGTTTPG